MRPLTALILGMMFHFQFTESELAGMFDRGRAPLLRIILDVR